MYLSLHFLVTQPSSVGRTGRKVWRKETLPREFLHLQNKCRLNFLFQLLHPGSSNICRMVGGRQVKVKPCFNHKGAVCFPPCLLLRKGQQASWDSSPAGLCSMEISHLSALSKALLERVSVGQGVGVMGALVRWDCRPSSSVFCNTPGLVLALYIHVSIAPGCWLELFFYTRLCAFGGQTLFLLSVF